MGKKQRRKNQQQDRAREIARLAERTARDSEDLDAYEELIALIGRKLDEDRGGIVTAAVEHLEDEDARDFLRVAVSLASQSIDVLLDGEDLGGDGDGEEIGEATLFAIPVVLAGRPHEPVGTRFEPDDAVASALVELGFVDSRSSLWVLPGLYTHDEIAASPAATRRLLRNAVQAFVRSDPLEERFRAANASLAAASVELRYIVLLTITAGDHDEPFAALDDEGGVPDLEPLLERIEGAVAEQLDVELVRAGLPGLLWEAVEDGTTHYRSVMLERTLAAAEGATVATVSRHGDAGEARELRVALFDGANAVLGHFVWRLAPHEDPDAVLELVLDVTRTTLESLEVVAHQDLYPLDSGDEANEPSLVAPDGELARARA